MDVSRFTDNVPGTFVEVDPKKQTQAFVPDPLPPDWGWPGELWPLLLDASNKLAELSGRAQSLPNPNLLLRPLQSRESITSSQIEGTFVTPAELLRYELDPTAADGIDQRRAAQEEVYLHGLALTAGQEALQAYPLGRRVIRAIHQRLMTGARGRSFSPGEFRKLQNQIGSAGRYIPPPPDRVGELMDNLEVFANRDSPVHALVDAFVAHYQFEAIHPFIDGNGRTGRIFLSLMVQQKLGHAQPWLYLSAFFDRYRTEYTDHMLRVSTHGDWRSWIEFCLRGTVAQSEDALHRCNLLGELKRHYDTTLENASSRSHPQIESLFHLPAVTARDVQENFDVSDNTARSDINRLCKAGVLRELPGSYPKTFYAPAIFSVAYTQDVSGFHTIDDVLAEVAKAEGVDL